MLTFFVLISVIGISFDSVKATSICRKPVTISDQYMGPSNRSFVIVGSNKKDGNGLGNKLVFFSAAYYIAATTGREILIEDHSIFGATCRHIHCGFPYRSEYFPKDYRRGESSFKFIYEDNDLLNVYMKEEMKKNESVFRTNIVLDGYLNGISLWPHVEEVSSCALELSGCSGSNNHACVNGYAISQLLQGPFKLPSHQRAVSRLLVGLNTSSELFHLPLQAMTSIGRRSEIDIAVHLRLEFNGFENSQVSSSSYRSEVDEWLASEQYKTLCTAIIAQIISVLSNTTATASIKKAKYSVYLAADNASVKNALYRHIQLAVSSVTQADNNILNQMEVTIMMLNMSNILHINHHITPMSHYNHDTFATMFDWYAITAANSLLSWSKNELRQSTFTQASIAMKYALNYTSPSYCLLSDQRKIPYWKQF